MGGDALKPAHVASPENMEGLATSGTVPPGDHLFVLVAVATSGHGLHARAGSSLTPTSRALAGDRNTGVDAVLSLPLQFLHYSHLESLSPPDPPLGGQREESLLGIFQTILFNTGKILTQPRPPIALSPCTMEARPLAGGAEAWNPTHTCP